MQKLNTTKLQTTETCPWHFHLNDGTEDWRSSGKMHRHGSMEVTTVHREKVLIRIRNRERK